MEPVPVVGFCVSFGLGFRMVVESVLVLVLVWYGSSYSDASYLLLTERNVRIDI